MLTIAGTVRLISDLHLQPELATVNQRFARFLDDCVAEKIAALFILGDLFEYWIGDDALTDPFNASVCQKLRAVSDAGIDVYFLHGNRDFLIGSGMATACGFHLLPDSVKVGAGGTATLLQHGDTLCTDDVAYQNFRTMVRAHAWQEAFLTRPLTERMAEVALLRERSRIAMRDKSPEIMDANGEAIRMALRESGCLRLIHGHTHRPCHESIALDDVLAERWVLSDWTDTRGDALEITTRGVERLALHA